MRPQVGEDRPEQGVVEVSSAVVAKRCVFRLQLGQKVLQRLALHGVPFECGVEFAHVPGMVTAVVDFHGGAVHGRLERVQREAQFGQSEAHGCCGASAIVGPFRNR